MHAWFYTLCCIATKKSKAIGHDFRFKEHSLLPDIQVELTLFLTQEYDEAKTYGGWIRLWITEISLTQFPLVSIDQRLSIERKATAHGKSIVNTIR